MPTCKEQLNFFYQKKSDYTNSEINDDRIDGGKGY